MRRYGDLMSGILSSYRLRLGEIACLVFRFFLEEEGAGVVQVKISR